ncbi:MAG: effector binding domain-containing protein, partial [Spirochaetaceae bacterium]|nr:effector binding domain-containing protein [Spirochaetaceae bacterium]
PLSIRVTMEGATPIKYKMTELETVTFLVIPRSFPVDIIEDESDKSISDFWGECIQNKMLERLKSFRAKNDNRVFGLCSELKEDSTSFVYALAVAVPEAFDFTHAPDGFTKWQVEKSRYVIFDCYGKDGDCISKAWENYFQNFLPQSGFQTKAAPDFEIYFDNGAPDLMCELWIPVF